MERRTTDELESRLQQRNAQLQAVSEQLAQELSRRKRIQAVSREWEERYRSLVENVPDVILVVDRTGEILFINHAVHEMSVDEVVGTSIFDYILASQLEGIKAYLEWVFEGGKPEAYEVNAQLPGGNTAWYSVRIGTIMHEGQVVALNLIATDVTDRKRVEDALQESEHFLQGVFDAIQDGLCVLDTDLSIVRVNRWMEEQYADKMPLVGKRCYDVFQGRQTPCIWCPCLETLKTGEAHSEEVPYPEPLLGNQTGWREISAFPLRDAQGMVVGVIEYVKDVTERRQAEEALQRRTEQLALLNRVIAASAASDDIKSILEVVCRELALAFDLSQAAAVLLKEGRTEAVVVAGYQDGPWPILVGESIPIENNLAAQYLLEQEQALIVDDAQTDELLGLIQSLTQARNIVSLLLLPLMIEGQVVGGLVLGATELRNPQDDSGRSFSREEVALAQRVMEQVSGALARTRLAETQRRLSTIIEQAAEAVMITDTEGVIIYINPAFERILGYKKAEVVGQRPNTLRMEGMNASTHQKMWQAVKAGQVWQERIEFQASDGTPVVLDQITAAVRNKAGEVVNYVSTLRDVTREVQLEKQFHQSQKMEALGRLAGGIAHDFNNLLTVIQLSTRLLEHQLRPRDPLWKHVQQIRETGDRASDLTKQLLSFSRQEIVELQVLNLNDVVDRLQPMLRRLIGEPIELKTSLTGDLWTVAVDPSQMEQVIVNLVVNARDAMPEGGTLTIETANVTLSKAYAASLVDAQPGEHVLLTVRDTGVGMDDDALAHLFEPFFTTKQRGRGTGLGLALIFGIVKQRGGHIRVDSKVGRGTTFRLYLPRATDVKAVRSEGALPWSRPGRRSHISDGLVQGTETLLVVEDEQAVRDLAVQVLTECGYEVLAAGDGRAALEISQQHEGPIELLLTDVVMPHMNGKELAAQLRVQWPEIRVLYMSGYTDKVIARQDIEAEDVALLTKPFSMRSLTEKIRAMLDSRD
jgi:two-component system cell cycle sensor histidine kinase/response regulator CckA